MTRSARFVPVALLLALALAPPAAAAGSAARSASAWRHVAGRPAPSHAGARPAVRPTRFQALELDRAALQSVLRQAPRERATGAVTAPLTLSLPAPGGKFERFAVQQTSVMEPGLAAKHPDIATYSGTGIDVPGATVHLDLTPLGFHASVRGPRGAWYVDPYYHRDQSLYVSYYGRDLPPGAHGTFVERDGAGAGAGGPSTDLTPRAPLRASAVQRRTYRLALASDPNYATYFGAANVTAAKVTLINRVNQIYEDDLAVHLTLIAANDLLNLNMAADMTGADGPCGTAACYSSDDASSCQGSTLQRTRIVIGQIVGAGSFDVGHLALGTNGGGLASLGVAGGNYKAQGCTGAPTPEGDLYAVDFVAHELGHQFSGSHPFNGTQGSCADGNRNAETSVEPGSGSSIMAYAGICGQDDLQPHSDPYFSQRSIEEMTTYVTSAQPAIDEVQGVALRNFDTDGDSFTLTYAGNTSAPIQRGVNYDAASIAAEVDALTGGTASVAGFDGSGAPDDTGFEVTFGGAQAGTATSLLSVTDPSGMTGFVGEVAKGGAVQNGGSTVVATGNRTPDVTAPADNSIPLRTPFTLTGSATDADGDTLTYLWEQNDAGGGVGTALVSNSKTDGPLFRQFGVAAIVDSTGTLQSPSPGENAATTSPTRVFPDMAQIVAGNTNAATGACPDAPPAGAVPAATVDCFSEFLPTNEYAGGTLHFRLTARDGHAGAGGVASADTALTLVGGAGPFRVTSQAAPATVNAGTQLPVQWAVASTNAAPISAANVAVTMSTDGGLTYPLVLSASTPNDGAQSFTVPNVATTHARIRVQAVGNVFFDVSHADLTINASPAPAVSNDAPAGGAQVQYSDALATALTVSATDDDSPGSALTAQATGLPAGMSLTAGAPVGGPPGSRTFTVTGATTAAPATYPVTVTVSDADGHSAPTSFSIVVLPEDAATSYTGDTTGTVAAGASTAAVTLRGRLVDSSAAAGATDHTAGDLATATVAFKEGSTTLCAPAPATPVPGAATSATASCTVNLPAGAHAVQVVAGGRYTGTGTGNVQVSAPGGTTTTPTTTTPTTTTPTPPPPTTTTPQTPPGGTPTPPIVARLGPVLSKVPGRLKATKSGVVTLSLACAAAAGGTAPALCQGTAVLTAKVKGRKRTIGRVSFSFPPGRATKVKIKLAASARKVLKKGSLAATLTVSVANGDAGAAKATKKVRIRR